MKKNAQFFSRKRWWQLLLIVVVSWIVYANTFKNSFLWDDILLIVKNEYIKNWKWLPYIFSTQLYQATQPSNFYRPLQSLSYMLDYSIWKLNPFGYHLTNLTLHILCSLLIYYFLSIISNATFFKLSRSESKPYDIKSYFPLFSALLFSIHPIQTEAVTYISGRADLLAGVFLLLSLVFFAKYMHFFNKKYYLGSLLCFVLSLLSRESAVVFPLILILYMHSFPPTNKLRFKDRARYLSSFFVILGIYIVLRLTIFNFGGIFKSRYSLGTRMLTSIQTIPQYIRLLFLPFNLHMERIISPVRSVFEPKMIGALLLTVCLFIIIAKLFKYSKIIFFSSVWFFIWLLPALNIVPTGKIFMAEHWLYLPSAGFFAILVISIDKIKKEKLKKFIYSIFISLLIFYSILTIRRNTDWNNPINFYEKTLKYSPNSPTLHYNLGSVYARQKSFEKAINEYKKTLAIDPHFKPAIHSIVNAYNDLGNSYANRGFINKAYDEYLKSIQLNPDFAPAHYNLGLIYLKKGMTKKALYEFRQALRINQGFTPAIKEINLILKDNLKKTSQ